MYPEMKMESLSVLSQQQQEFYQRYVRDTRAELRRRVPEDMIPSIALSDKSVVE